MFTNALSKSICPAYAGVLQERLRELNCNDCSGLALVSNGKMIPDEVCLLIRAVWHLSSSDPLEAIVFVVWNIVDDDILVQKLSLE